MHLLPIWEMKFDSSPYIAVTLESAVCRMQFVSGMLGYSDALLFKQELQLPDDAWN